MNSQFQSHIGNRLDELTKAGLYKREREILGPQGSEILVAQGKALNFCANNYLGLSSHPELIQAAHGALDTRGFGLSSVRFICGTQDIHRELERAVAKFTGMDDAILFSSCFDANGGVFEALFDAEDAIISDELNHASIIDGIRLCKAQRLRYKNCNMQDLEAKLLEAKDARFRLVVTDGAFSMDGAVAPLAEICALAARHDALVMVDDSHATGFFGENGRGTHEAAGVINKIDLLTSTFGKALGGSAGGFVAARGRVVEMLRQKARPYLFSNSIPPVVVMATLKALSLIQDPKIGGKLREQIWANTRLFREKMSAAGFNIKAGNHPVVPVMLGEAKLAQEMSAELLKEGIYVIGFFYPVVPQGLARIRVQISAAHTTAQIETAIAAFIRVGTRLGVIRAN